MALKFNILIIGMTSGYTFSKNPQELFEKFFGTKNPFANFGFSEASPFVSKLTKPPPKKPEPITHTLECTITELYNGVTKKFNITRKRLNELGNLVDNTKLILIHVKPGWKAGTKIIFPNEGDESIDESTLITDVVFIVAEKDDISTKSFVRQGNNLIYTHKISLADALTDCSLQIPVLDGRILSIACPEVVSPSYEKVIEGEGMPIPKLNGIRGNLIIKFHILFPQYLKGSKRDKIREILAGEALME